ncbi:MAG: hypothetical protein QOC63_3918 [Mycobacterium sp.]|jgi:hypothetical protein|nr:hypothetical protein [Mycobacterium sp.]
MSYAVLTRLESFQEAENGWKAPPERCEPDAYCWMN